MRVIQYGMAGEQTVVWLLCRCSTLSRMTTQVFRNVSVKCSNCGYSGTFNRLPFIPISMHTIYLLKRKSTDEVVYVGVGICNENAPDNFDKTIRMRHNPALTHDYLEKPTNYVLVIKRRVESLEAADRWERFYADQYNTYDHYNDKKDMLCSILEPKTRKNVA